ncbi:MAG: phosphoribosyltransferase family protein [Eubacteriales bacterium]|nr:phosphoribosyltransferase family protein [Eubacteriales bacterium]
MNNFLSALDRLTVFVIPKRCELCGEVVEVKETVCPDCKNPPRIAPPVCEKCGCSKADCICKNKNEFKRIVAPYYYTDKIVAAVHRFKDGNMEFLAKRFILDMTKCVKENYGDISFDAVTFVPMRFWDEFKRGYNQSELLAKGIADNIDVPIMKLLAKTERTKPQKAQSERQRKVNVFGVFDVTDKDFVQDKTILLVDDVKTTGSTLNECAKMLKIYGAKEVYCVSLAIVKHKKDKKKSADANKTD